MDDWRSDPTWRYEERLFVDGRPTLVVRDGVGEHIDPIGLAELEGVVPAGPERTNQLSRRADVFAPPTLRPPVVEGGATSLPPPVVERAWLPPVPPPPSLPVRAPSRFRRVKVVAVVVALLAGVGVVVANAVRPHGPQWASAWDPRVEPLARFVEQHRGLTFTHPVTVEFVSERDFVNEEQAQATDSAGSSSDGPDNPLWEAFGLVTSSFDAAATGSDAATGIVGLYDPSTRRIRVRGEELTVDVKVTLVHELTHALQDQRLDAGDLDPVGNGGRAAVLAVIEGDATEVEDQYIAQLSDSDREAYAAAVDSVVGVPEQDRIPDIVNEESGLRYLVGPRFVRAVETLDGHEARDQLFTEPPTSELEILFPDKFLNGFTVRDVARPQLRQGEKIIRRFGADGNDAGALTWLAVLAQRVDTARATAAVEGWGGDAFVAFHRDDRVCARATIVGASAFDTNRLADVFAAWAAAGPPRSANVTHTADEVVVESCGVNGSSAGGPSGASGSSGASDSSGVGAGGRDPLELVALRAEVLVADSLSKLSNGERTCVADKAVERATAEVFEALSSDDEAKATAAADGLITSAGTACGLTLPRLGR